MPICPRVRGQSGRSQRRDTLDPETQDLRWRVVIDRQAGPPDERTDADLTQVGQAVRDHGGDLLDRFRGAVTPKEG